MTLAARRRAHAKGTGFLNRRTMFPAGIETRVRRIVLPPRAATFEPAPFPPSVCGVSTRDSLITFHADGSYESQPLRTARADDRHAARRRAVLPRRQRRRRLARTRYRQRQSARVLAGAHRHRRRSSLRRRSARTGASDYLGLVAERTVEIDEPGGDGHGRSRGARFDLRAQPLSHPRLLSPRSGTLLIYGSVAAGSVSATEPRFATRIEFDNRLTTMRAPGFPLSDRYELDETAGEWRVVGAATAD